ncbi:MAG: hypothetical protein ACK5I7_07550 [Anaerotignum sp.]
MKKIGLLAMVTTFMLALGGCGTSANNLSGATDDYDNGYTNGYNDNSYNDGTYTSSGGAAYWDGYGVNNGRSMTEDVGNGVKDAGRDIANSVESAFDGNTAKVAS